MSKNVFKAQSDFVQRQKRNTFDLSFQNNLTLNFGTLYPVFCKEVIPGDSFRIKPTFGLKAMPMVFPVQTRMQANLHFFYVRNRNLWKDWPDFIGRTKSDLVPPYLSPQNVNSMLTSRKIGDYFNIPTHLYGRFGTLSPLELSDFLFNGHHNYSWQYEGQVPGDTEIFGYIDDYTAENTLSPDEDINTVHLVNSVIFNYRSGLNGVRIHLYNRTPSTNNIYLNIFVTGDTTDGESTNVLAFLTTQDISGSPRLTGLEFVGQGNGYYYCDFRQRVPVGFICSDVLDVLVQEFGELDSYPFTDVLSVIYENFTDVKVGIGSEGKLYDEGDPDIKINYLAGCNSRNPSLTGTWYGIDELYLNGVSSAQETDVDITESSANPYVSGDVKISALPFRAYESIYNAFYRNQIVAPFKINGVAEYNRYVTNLDGGEDTHIYELFNRNWELDFLTSATPTPQQGDITPLVGVSSSGEFTFENSDGTTYTVKPIIGEDGNTLTGIDSYSGTPENNSGLRRMMDVISHGISINDFRNVNALQRWLETNLRRGYKYRDQIKSHFDVDIHYNELNMPEFIGGMSEPILVNQVNQTTGSEGGQFADVLGSFAGQASVFASSKHTINHYCDEHGFIIGIFSLCPVPNYSQILPKMFIKDNVLDYYFPEFGHIGNQPITYREVCPLQLYAAQQNGENVSLNDVFGYNRAWYDYIASVDEVHGLMRTESMRNFLINRVFDSFPELSEDFITVKGEHLNDVFAVTDNDVTDKFVGQIYFDVLAQRPIPRVLIPSLE